MFDKIQLLLDRYKPISLEEVETVKLMNRVDTKYVVAVEIVERLLTELADDYMVLEIDSQRFGQYRSVYYDTPDLQMFHTHITSRYPRFKVRERTYSQNGLQFLEVKRKKTDGRTSKKRLRLNDETGFDAAADNVVVPNTPFHKEDLLPRLGNRFNRVTLVNKARTERLTLDFNLQFDSVTDDGASKNTPVFEQAVIVELKQDKKADSPIARRLKDENIRKCGMSKYCVGMLLLNNDLSSKMYKRNLMKFLNTTQWTS